MAAKEANPLQAIEEAVLALSKRREQLTRQEAYAPTSEGFSEYFPLTSYIFDESRESAPLDCISLKGIGNNALRTHYHIHVSCIINSLSLILLLILNRALELKI